MRKLFISFAMALMAIGAWGNNGMADKGKDNNGFFSFCKEGKKWNYIQLDVSADPIEQPYSYEVRGDTVVSEMSYKKVYYHKNGVELLAFMIREEGKKVFKLYPDKEESLFFDFERDDVGQVHSWTSWDGLYITNWMISVIDTVVVNNNYFRRYCCHQEYFDNEHESVLDGQIDYWVEGIGDARYGIEAKGLEIVTRLPGKTEYFVSCYENGECIFTADDFTRPANTTDVKKVNGDIFQDMTLFDLQGRKLQHTPQKGLYIQNGKKRIMR